MRKRLDDIRRTLPDILGQVNTHVHVYNVHVYIHIIYIYIYYVTTVYCHLVLVYNVSIIHGKPAMPYIIIIL